MRHFSFGISGPRRIVILAIVAVSVVCCVGYYLLRIVRYNRSWDAMASCENAAGAFVRDSGGVPKSLDDLVRTGYLARIHTTDGWGTDLVIRRDESGYVIHSFGPDGREGTRDDFGLIFAESSYTLKLRQCAPPDELNRAFRSSYKEARGEDFQGWVGHSPWRKSK